MKLSPIRVDCPRCGGIIEIEVTAEMTTVTAGEATVTVTPQSDAAWNAHRCLRRDRPVGRKDRSRP